MDQQSMIVPVTQAAGNALGHQTRSLAQKPAAQTDNLALFQTQDEWHPPYELLASMPGVGFKTAARILTEAGGQGAKTHGWNQALQHLMLAYPERLEAYLG